MNIRGKRGQQLTLGTVILIVLGIAVLVFLIFGFSMGWKNLWDNIVQRGGGGSNLDTIRSGCELACIGENEDQFCNQMRTINFGEKRAVTLKNNTVQNVTKLSGSCYLFANNYTNLGIEECSAIASC